MLRARPCYAPDRSSRYAPPNLPRSLPPFPKHLRRLLHLPLHDMRVNPLLLLQLRQRKILCALDLAQAILPNTNSTNISARAQIKTYGMATYRFTTGAGEWRTHIPFRGRVEERQCLALGDGP